MKTRLVLLGQFFLVALGFYIVLLVLFAFVGWKTSVSQEEVIIHRNYIPFYFLAYEVDLLSGKEVIYQNGPLAGDFLYITYKPDHIDHITMRKSGHVFHLQYDGQVLHRMRIAEETLPYEQCHLIFEAALAERDRVREKYSHLIIPL